MCPGPRLGGPGFPGGQGSVPEESSTRVAKQDALAMGQGSLVGERFEARGERPHLTPMRSRQRNQGLRTDHHNQWKLVSQVRSWSDRACPNQLEVCRKFKMKPEAPYLAQTRSLGGCAGATLRTTPESAPWPDHHLTHL